MIAAERINSQLLCENAIASVHERAIAYPCEK